MKQTSTDRAVSRQKVQGILALIFLVAMLLSSPQTKAQRPNEPSTEEQSALDGRIMGKTADPCEDLTDTPAEILRQFILSQRQLKLWDFRSTRGTQRRSTAVHS